MINNPHSHRNFATCTAGRVYRLPNVELVLSVSNGYPRMARKGGNE